MNSVKGSKFEDWNGTASINVINAQVKRDRLLFEPWFFIR